MGKRGPPPKPTARKKLEGTYRPDRAAKREATPESKAPPMPTWLGKGPWGREAAREWKRIVPLLEAVGLLAELDRASLAAYCHAYGRFWYYQGLVAKVGSVQVAKSGYRGIQPEVTEMHKALAELRKWCALFGLSPADRSRVDAASAPPEKEVNPFLELVK